MRNFMANHNITGGDIKKYFEAQRTYEPKGPLVSEISLFLGTICLLECCSSFTEIHVSNAQIPMIHRIILLIIL